MRMEEDYYKILQVHYLAEPEIIDSAYKRLAKKYHPDINKSKDAKEIMQSLNKAYEVLSNPGKREVYNMKWKENNETPKEHDYNPMAKSVLNEYFGSIAGNQLDLAYELISNVDKENISKDEFINWQKAVSVVYRLLEYNCKFNQALTDKLLCGHLYNDVKEFNVAIEEYNEVMDMVEKSIIKKMVVLDKDDKWRVFIGHEKIQPLIGKFKSLTGLLNAKSVIQELTENHSRIDSLTGILNQKGVREEIEGEIQRFERYGNSFSLVLCEVQMDKIIKKERTQEIEDFIISSVTEILINNLRKIDIIGAWEKNKFLILLPETDLVSAIKVANKIKEIFRAEVIRKGSIVYKISASFGIAEYVSSLEETLGKLIDSHSER